MYSIYKCDAVIILGGAWNGGYGGYGGQLLAKSCTPVFHKAPKHVWVQLDNKWMAELISTPGFVDWKEGALSTSSSSTPIYIRWLCITQEDVY